MAAAALLNENKASNSDTYLNLPPYITTNYYVPLLQMQQWGLKRLGKKGRSNFVEN
jgi:hypothetical protein